MNKLIFRVIFFIILFVSSSSSFAVIQGSVSVYFSGVLYNSISACVAAAMQGQLAGCKNAASTGITCDSSGLCQGHIANAGSACAYTIAACPARPSCPANSTLSSDGTCACAPGFIEQDGQCKPQCTAGDQATIIVTAGVGQISPDGKDLLNQQWNVPGSTCQNSCQYDFDVDHPICPSADNCSDPNIYWVGGSPGSYVSFTSAFNYVSNGQSCSGNPPPTPDDGAGTGSGTGGDAGSGDTGSGDTGGGGDPTPPGDGSSSGTGGGGTGGTPGTPPSGGGSGETGGGGAGTPDSPSGAASGADTGSGGTGSGGGSNPSPDAGSGSGSGSGSGTGDGTGGGTGDGSGSGTGDGSGSGTGDGSGSGTGDNKTPTDCSTDPTGSGCSDGNAGPGLPGIPTLYTAKYPDGISGVWDQQVGALRSTPVFILVGGMFPTGIDGGASPVWIIDLNLGGLLNFGTFDLSPDASIWPILRAIVICSALLLAYKLVFGGA